MDPINILAQIHNWINKPWFQNLLFFLPMTFLDNNNVHYCSRNLNDETDSTHKYKLLYLCPL